MTEPGDLFGRLVVRAQLAPDAPAVLGDQIALPVSALAGVSQAIALNLRVKGARDGEILAVHSDDLVMIVASVFAASATGMKWVFAGPALAQSGIRAHHLLYSDNLPAGDFASVHKAGPDWVVQPPGTLSRPRDAMELWISTSGTTGLPKLARIGEAAVIARAAATADLLGNGRRHVTLFPGHTAAALLRALAAVIEGGTVVEAAKTSSWKRLGVDLVVASPAQIASYLDETENEHLEATIHVGGGFLSDDLARRLLSRFTHVADAYGSTEANLTLLRTKSLGADGKIVSHTVWRDAEVQIVTTDGQPVTLGQEGAVRIRASGLASGYVGIEDSEILRDGWFWPGDLAFTTSGGEFHITGRTNDLFNLGGVKINAAMIDAVLQRVGGVRDAIAFMRPGDGKADELRMFLVLEPESDATHVISDAKIALISAFGKSAAQGQFLFIDKIPRTETGKPDRRAAASMVAAARAERR